MGSIIFGPKVLPDNLTEIAGYKVGLAMSIEEICDHLTGTSFPDTVRDGEISGVRLRSEVYEDLYYNLLHRIGYTRELYHGSSFELAQLYHRAKANAPDLDFYMQVSSTMTHFMRNGVQNGDPNPTDPMVILAEVKKMFGAAGVKIAIEMYEIINRGIGMNPHFGCGIEWINPLELKGLFKGTDQQPEKGRFIDQRYIDYLSNNNDRIGDMHWRQFEKLTAEFYERDGYKVDLGPGSGDDGVDVRVWKPEAGPGDSPLCIVQCKRQKDKIEKVVVKGLHADVQFARAEYGVIVTTSELSPGAKTTISARGYDIQAVERDGVKGWLTKLRTPGTGIVR
ncbi:restriction endonuclease [Rhodoferax sp.]|uniref:restriction endonuclease n=1 Tax=Rhodoferax sp. TaxID=50421 RepID=UPI002636BEFB|nr:restriction endonuclease [Rhodoferax sp.]MDD3937149.1 restriction endonuclease [Rhodoferax sp.]